MDFINLEVPVFLKDLQEFKKAYLEEYDQPEDEFTEISFESMDILLKELKGQKNGLDGLSKDMKKKLYPHIALVFFFFESISEDDEFGEDEFDLEEEDDLELR